MNINEKEEKTMKYEYFYLISVQLNEINAEKMIDWIGDKLGDKLGDLEVHASCK